MLQQRAVFFEQIKSVPLSDLVVLDESYATTQFTPLRGRALRGVRLVQRVPHGHWKLLTVLAAMTVQGVLTAASVNASTDSQLFVLFIEQALVPSLRPGQVVIMDNLAAHKVAAVRMLIEAAGCRLVYLPPYSPDYSPIEPMWSKFKTVLRTMNARSVEALNNAIGDALHTITSTDCQSYFHHCGYTLQAN